LTSLPLQFQKGVISHPTSAVAHPGRLKRKKEHQNSPRAFHVGPAAHYEKKGVTTRSAAGLGNQGGGTQSPQKKGIKRVTMMGEWRSIKKIASDGLPRITERRESCLTKCKKRGGVHSSKRDKENIQKGREVEKKMKGPEEGGYADIIFNPNLI